MLFTPGSLFETSFMSASGHQVGVLAETAIDGSTLTLKDVTIYAEGSEAANAVGARDFVQMVSKPPWVTTWCTERGGYGWKYVVRFLRRKTSTN
jgi:hypothetical protein